MKKVIENEKHFTASVWIISQSKPVKMLLIHHKKSGKWQQPGGHIELFEDPVEAAVREVLEETGLNIDFLKKRIEKIDDEVSFIPIPEFIMDQFIPAHNDQPNHHHIDLNYVLEIDSEKMGSSVILNAAEARDIKWFTKEEIGRLPTHSDTKIIVEKLM